MTTMAAPAPKNRYQLNRKSRVAVVGGTVCRNPQNIRTYAANPS